MDEGTKGQGKRQASAAERDWNRFATDLAVCLGDLEEDECLIVSCKRANYFVQFAAQGKHGMRAEAVSNSFIEPPEALLSVEDYDRLIELGWLRATNEPPTEPGEYEAPDGSPNFYMDIEPPVEFEALARLATQTLRDVYRVRHPGELQYGAFDDDGTEIRFPALRLKRVRG